MKSSIGSRGKEPSLLMAAPHCKYLQRRFLMTRTKCIVLLVLLCLSMSVIAFGQAAEPGPAPAAPAAAAPAAPAAPAQPTADTGDTAWMLTSAALVLFMTIPGLFLFYGGLVRSKNVLGMFMQNFI